MLVSRHQSGGVVLHLSH